MIRVTKCLIASVSFATILIASCAGILRAQGSRKDDIVFNAQGKPMAGATVRVCTSAATGQPCAPLALVYSDSALTQALANPLTADGLGNYNFYAAPGRYTIEFSGPGIITKQIPNVILPSDPSTPTFTSITTTSGISAFSLSLTGNLTVNGSTAVAGSLTVGGLPVPTANQDNQWTAGQRFKGPIPWRDISAYMPAGGCSSIIPFPLTDPPTTATITSGSATLTLGNARDFKNGCGIAVVNAGPTSTIAAPNQACAIASIARSGNVVTVTCSAGHNLIVNGGAYGEVGIQITGVTDSSYNGTFFISGVADTTHFTYAQTAGNSSSSGGTATAQFGYAHGATGATTYNYKVSAVDGNGGMSAASPAITITTGNATLTTQNYNWITFGIGGTLDPRNRSDRVPHAWVIYSDKGLGGAYSCVGTAYTNAYSDFGLPLACPVFAPATPPAAATPQVLNAIISAGGGTTSLTLSATASNTATTQNVYHDESSFLFSCATDDQNDRAVTSFPHSVGAFGCYVPAGNYFFNGPMPTDTLANTYGGTITFAGTPFFNIFPWYFSQNAWFAKGLGNSGAVGSFSHANTVDLHTGANLAAAVVLRSVDNVGLDGFVISNSGGHGIWDDQVAYLTSPASHRLDNLLISSGAAGAPLVLGNNVIGVWANNDAFNPPSSANGLPAVYITMDNWDGNSNGVFYFDNISSTSKGFKFDAPGGNGSGGGIGSIYINNWVSESLGASEKALLVHDFGPNAPGVSSTVIPLNNISIHNLNNSDPVNGPAAYTLFEELGIGGGGYLGIGPVDANFVNSFGGMLSCGPNSTVCNDRPQLTGNVQESSVLGGTWGGQLQTTSTTIYAEMPILSRLAYNQFGGGFPAWAQSIPPLGQFQVTGTGAGGLAASTYCMTVEGKDARTPPGLTAPTNTTLCQTVGASSSITVSWSQAAGSLNGAYSGFRFFFCNTAGSSCTPNTYIDLVPGGSPYTYVFTSTAGGIGGTLNTDSTAYLSYLNWDVNSKSCLFCASPAGNPLWQLGIGEPNPGAGVKLAVAGGTIQGEGGIQAGADVAFNASPRGSYNGFVPNLTSSAGTYQRMTLDKAITVTRLQLVLGTAGAGCTTQSTVSVTDGASSVTLTTANGTAIYDSGVVSQNFAASANLDIKIATAASGCATAPQNANVAAQYRMQ